MKISYTPRAVADLQQIAEYLVPRSPQGAGRVCGAILKTLSLVARFPRLGRRQTLGDVRKIAVRQHPYLIYYVIDENAQEITVLTVRHAARERPFEDH